MARIEIAPDVFDDLDRLVEHMIELGVDEIDGRIDQLIESIGVLVHSPQIGRPGRGGKQELVIGTGARGYIALYRYVDVIDTVFVLAVRAQREAGYKRRRARK